MVPIAAHGRDPGRPAAPARTLRPNMNIQHPVPGARRGSTHKSPRPATPRHGSEGGEVTALPETLAPGPAAGLGPPRHPSSGALQASSAGPRALRSRGRQRGRTGGDERRKTGRERIAPPTCLQANSLVRRLCARGMTGAWAPRRGLFPRRVSGTAPAAAHAGRALLHPRSKRARRRALPALGLFLRKGRGYPGPAPHARRGRDEE